MVYVSIIVNIVLIIFSIWFLYFIFKLFMNKEYAKNPPFLPTIGGPNKELFKQVSSILDNAATPLNIVDPGCGIGSLIIPLAKKNPNHNFTGIEWNKTLSKITKFRTRKLKNTTIINDDLFNYSFSDANIIVCFLLQPLMPKISEKIQECKSGTDIFSVIFTLENLEEISSTKTLKHYKV